MTPQTPQQLFEAYLQARRSLVFEQSSRIGQDLRNLAEFARVYAATNGLEVPAEYAEPAVEEPAEEASPKGEDAKGAIDLARIAINYSADLGLICVRDLSVRTARRLLARVEATEKACRAAAAYRATFGEAAHRTGQPLDKRLAYRVQLGKQLDEALAEL